MSLSGKRAVVTGGGTGIGAACARALSAAGAAVVVAARRRDAIDAVAAELTQKGRKVWAVGCDVGDAASVAAMAREASAHMGGVDILVNSAGIAVSSPLKSLTLEEWNRHWLVNATGAMHCMQALLPGMAERGWGRVVNVASVAARTGAAYLSAYAASKHALLGLTRSVAAEMAEKGITVNAVCPGYVDTDLTRQTVDRIVEKTGKTREAAMEYLAAQSPQKRLMTPDEVAFTVAFLCDARARGINGQALVIDGGALLV